MNNILNDLFTFSEQMPLSIRTVKLNQETVSIKRHAETEFLFILRGSSTLLVNDKSYTLVQDDVVLINENAAHEIISNDCLILSILINLKEINHPFASKRCFYSLNSSGETDSKKYNHIRHLIAQIVKVNSSGENLYLTYSVIYSMINHLHENFLDVASSNTSQSRKYRNRLTEILSYIDSNYRNAITLSDVAQELNLSVPYLSSFFKKNMQMTFTEYYNDIRLIHAVSSMISSDTTLENIALDNGFPDSRSFVTQFKKKYGITPSVYRREKKYLQQQAQLKSDQQQQNISNNDDLKNLAKYLRNVNQENSNFTSNSRTIIDAGVIDLKVEGVQLKHHYKNFCSLGSARQLLYSDVQDMLLNINSIMKYKYIKFHGILSDEMMVYTEDQDGNPSYSFTLIDKILDFLVKINLKPLIQLSFMPRALASDPSKMINMNTFNTSPPKSMSKWKTLINKLITHMIHRYGINEVKSWLFCVWNEPDTSHHYFGWENPQQFYNFYKDTYHTVKSIHPDFKFGTPSLLLMPSNTSQWVDNFLKYCSDNSCVADFMNIHFYDNNFVEGEGMEEFSLKNLEKQCPLNEDIFAFTKYINEIKGYLKDKNHSHMPVYLTEWNLTISHRDLINDTCFKSCYLTKNLLENYDRLDSYGYWCITDFIEEMQLPNNMYHGGLGMFTHNGIPKAHYNTFCMLPHLGNELIKRGRGYFATRQENKLSIIVYNFEQYTKLFANGILFDMEDKNRYAAFSEMSNAKFTIQFNSVNASKCSITETFVNQKHGSSYDVWVLMGAPEFLRLEDVEHLKQQSRPGMYIHAKDITDGSLSLEIELEPLEVRLIEINLF